MLRPGSRFAYENDGCATVSQPICEGARGWVALTFDDGYRNYYQWQDVMACELSCFNSGERVMIIPGSRYSNENTGCATVNQGICEGGSYEQLRFDDGYRNWYQHQDLMPCGTAASTEDDPSHRICDGKARRGPDSCREYSQCLWRGRRCQSVASVIKKQMDRKRSKSKEKWCNAFSASDEIMCDESNWKTCRRSNGGGLCNWSWRRWECRPKYLLKLYQGLDQEDQDRVLAENECLGERPEPDSRRNMHGGLRSRVASNTRENLAEEALYL